MSSVKERRQELGMRQQDLLAKLKEYEPRLDIGTLSRIESGICLRHGTIFSIALRFSRLKIQEPFLGELRGLSQEPSRKAKRTPSAGKSWLRSWASVTGPCGSGWRARRRTAC